MLLSSPTLLDTFGPRLRSTISVWTTNPRTSSDLPSDSSGIPITRVSITLVRTRCPGVPVKLCTCRARLSLSDASIVTAVSFCCRRAFSCWVAAAICSRSSGVDTVVHARGATRYACSLQVPALDPSFDRSSWLATTFPHDTLVTCVPWSSHRSARFPWDTKVYGSATILWVSAHDVTRRTCTLFFCADERSLWATTRDVVSRQSTLHRDDHMWSDRKKELVHFSICACHPWLRVARGGLRIVTHTFRKIMEIVEEFFEKSYNNNGKLEIVDDFAWRTQNFGHLQRFRIFMFFFVCAPSFSIFIFFICSFFFFFFIFSFSNRPSRRQNSHPKKVDKFLLQKKTIVFSENLRLRVSMWWRFRFHVFFFFFFHFRSFFLKRCFFFSFFCCIPSKNSHCWHQYLSFNCRCFFRSRCSKEMPCHDDIRRDSWEWVAPLAWERAWFNSPEWRWKLSAC